MTGRSSVERVAGALRAEMLEGEVPPGTWLREEVLAERFRAGRYTVRAALSSLVASGLLVHERNRGVRVPELTRARIDDLYGFRSVVELGALRIALRNRADLRHVEAAVADLEAMDDTALWSDVTTAHGRIHHEIVAAADSPRLLAAFDGCRDELRFLTAFVRTDITASTIARLHRELMFGLSQGGDAAIEALTLDIEVSGRAALARALERQIQGGAHQHSGRSAS
jgi:DNA-binding GntR family transcriptional regulator